MLRKVFPVILFMAGMLGRAEAQSLTVETYTNQLLFNVFRDQPDTSIRDFIRLYIPALLKKTTDNTANLSGNKSISEIHSFIFSRHPFFNTSFTKGKLEFYCQRFPEPKGVQVYDIKLWFDFDTQEDAEMAYAKLIETFSPISTKQKKFSVSGAMVAQFTDLKGSKGFNKIQIRLTADNLDRRHFKILFEPNNDLE